jgi:predicted N-acetyltransferase YhbS
VDMVMERPDQDGARLAPIDEAEGLAIERLLDLVFGSDRHQRTAYRLRDGVHAEPLASCTAFDPDGMLIGSLQSWPLGLFDDAGGVTPLWLVGPIAVHPDRRNEGIGRAMLRRALAAIDATGLPAVLIGDEPYYGPFGFSAVETGDWSVPGPVDRRRLLVRRIDGRALPANGSLGPRRVA